MFAGGSCGSDFCLPFLSALCAAAPCAPPRIGSSSPAGSALQHNRPLLPAQQRACRLTQLRALPLLLGQTMGGVRAVPGEAAKSDVCFHTALPKSNAPRERNFFLLPMSQSSVKRIYLLFFLNVKTVKINIQTKVHFIMSQNKCGRQKTQELVESGVNFALSFLLKSSRILSVLCLFLMPRHCGSP